MGAISGTFVKFDSVPTRKVVRIIVEAPIEQADIILKTLGGFPDPSNAKWVGIAPLAVKPENTLKGGSLSKSAALLCTERAFQQWTDTTGEDDAAEYIRIKCGVTSRAHLDHNEEAARAFRDMKLAYEAWLKVAA